MDENAFVAGAPPCSPLRELTTLPRNPQPEKRDGREKEDRVYMKGNDRPIGMDRGWKRRG